VDAEQGARAGARVIQDNRQCDRAGVYQHADDREYSAGERLHEAVARSRADGSDRRAGRRREYRAVPRERGGPLLYRIAVASRWRHHDGVMHAALRTFAVAITIGLLATAQRT